MPAHTIWARVDATDYGLVETLDDGSLSIKSLSFGAVFSNFAHFDIRNIKVGTTGWGTADLFAPALSDLSEFGGLFGNDGSIVASTGVLSIDSASSGNHYGWKDVGPQTNLYVSFDLRSRTGDGSPDYHAIWTNPGGLSNIITGLYNGIGIWNLDDSSGSSFGSGPVADAWATIRLYYSYTGGTPVDVALPPVGRVLIAFDDGPLEPSPTWTRIDGGTGGFPSSFVSGYDIASGRQTLLAQTDTGTATVYVNDHKTALFDPRNASSPYFGKLDGRQILLQLYNPVTTTWESQFQGHIDNVTYDIDGSAVDPNGDPINASIQIECVDVFDYLAGYGLTPGLDGVAPPAGAEDGVWYAETASDLDDRIIEILTDVGIDESRYIVFSGNVAAQAVKYDPDESALTALRDACDAEFPFIANMYVDRFGRFVFHGRYGRFDPVGVSTDAGPDRWDFHSWKLGDGKAIQADATRTQIRVLSYARSRSDIINVAVCYPANMKAAQMPSQVYADTASITAYGKHAAPPMSDLLTQRGIFDTNTANAECFLFAKLLVKNQKDPRESITAIQLKSVDPSDARATTVWAALTKSDVSDLANVAVGYPGGTGFSGSSPDDDYFVEGRRIQVRPLHPAYDYVELDLELSPFVWSADTHNVFPPRI